MSQSLTLIPEKKKVGRPCKPRFYDWNTVQEVSQMSREASLTLTLKREEIDFIKDMASDLGMEVECFVMSKIDMHNTKLHYPEFTRHYGQTYVSHTL